MSMEKEFLLIDLGAAYPGDLLGESLINEFPEILVQCLESYKTQYTHLKPILRVSQKNCKDKLEAFLSSSWEIQVRAQELYLYDVRSPLNEKQEIFGGDQVYLKMVKDSDQSIAELPICLWGAVPKLGFHWVSKEASLNEVFQVTGNGGARLDKVLLNGPLGDLYLWNDIKDKKMEDFPYFLKTIHFFEEGDIEGFEKTWKEFFVQDSCKRCLPCFYKRRQLPEGNIKFKVWEQFDCHLPALYSSHTGYFLKREKV